MFEQPNILFLMADQMQGRVFDPEHPCRTPNLDKLIARGVRLRRAYTPNAVCSPARASLMTGLLPHNHGVLEVTHTVDDDQGNLRTQNPHWAQRLQDAGYRTGYFGKWHVERSNDLSQFGWQHAVLDKEIGQRRRQLQSEQGQSDTDETEQPLSFMLGQPGYKAHRFYGTTDVPVEQRFMGLTTQAAGEFLDEALQGEQPWCCFVSTAEPHDPFIAGREVVETYDIDALPLQPNINDDLSDKPGIYRRSARVFSGMDDQNKREAAACYYASITEIDAQFGRLLDQVEAAGQTDNTIVVLTSDHGELLGAHGLYCKNYGAFEEVYNIPIIVAGPGVASGVLSEARVGLHDLCPTLLELTGCQQIETVDSRSFAPVLREPSNEKDFHSGYAEYYGTRYRLTQKVLWSDSWKLVFNGFDEDELYNLDDDPYELRNLINVPAYDEQLRVLYAQIWEIIRENGDHAVLNARYAPLRIARYGPDSYAI